MKFYGLLIKIIKTTRFACECTFFPLLVSNLTACTLAIIRLSNHIFCHITRNIFYQVQHGQSKYSELSNYHGTSELKQSGLYIRNKPLLAVKSSCFNQEFFYSYTVKLDFLTFIYTRVWYQHALQPGFRT